MEVEKDGFMDKESVVVAKLADKENETAYGVEGVATEQEDNGGQVKRAHVYLEAALRYIGEDDCGLNGLPELTPNLTRSPSFLLTFSIPACGIFKAFLIN